MKNRLILLVVLWTQTLPVRAVTYGTHSTVYTPAVSLPVMHTAMPTMHMRSTSAMPTMHMRSTSAMPMMTHGAAAPSYATSSAGASSPSRPIGHIRRAKPEGDGSGGSTVVDGGETWYWDEVLEDWVNITPVGTIKEEGGIIYEWNGSEWVRKSQIADLGTPVGDAPWLWMFLLLAAYALFLGRKVRSERVNE